MKEVRVRYAPSPTGYLHIGNARTALFNYLFAKHNNGKFILRIEDTDLERNIEGGEKSQMEYLKWLGITWDESVDIDGGYGPYRQLDRLEIYQSYAQKLIDSGAAYKCYCTQEELEEERKVAEERGEIYRYSQKCLHRSEEERLTLEEHRPYTIRFKVPKDTVYRFDDIVKGKLEFHSKDISGDWVIIKQNGIATYNFACVIDDYLMKISHVLRGEDHISNTPKQLMVYEALGFEAPIFGHMTLIVNDQKKKLSKRDASIIQFIEQYKELGYLPEALFNFITLLGWSPVGEEEIFTKEEFIEQFDAKRLSKSPAAFDREKLAWINNRYMKEASLEQVMELALPHLEKEYDLSTYSPEYITDVISLYKDQISYGQEIVEVSKQFFETMKLEEEAIKFLQEHEGFEILETLYTFIENEETFSPESIKEILKLVGKETGAKGKRLFMSARIATTHCMSGPELPHILSLYGKQKVLKNIKSVQEIEMK